MVGLVSGKVEAKVVLECFLGLAGRQLKAMFPQWGLGTKGEEKGELTASAGDISRPPIAPDSTSCRISSSLLGCEHPSPAGLMRAVKSESNC